MIIEPADNAGENVVLTLLGGFELRAGAAVLQVPYAGQRLLAFLAVHERPVHRIHVAGCLWADSGDERASASLRSTLWRLGRRRTGIVQCAGAALCLSDTVRVDFRVAAARARAVIDRPDHRVDSDATTLAVAGDLLPDWYDEWVVVERERFRQLRLHALEALCDVLADEGRYAQAAEAGLAAVAGDPLRESAHRALIAAYLSEGNRSDAVRQYEWLRRLLAEHLGLAPSERLAALLGVTQRATQR
jgi:DNA-binding SARP family transcriptional activator